MPFAGLDHLLPLCFQGSQVYRQGKKDYAMNIDNENGKFSGIHRVSLHSPVSRSNWNLEM